MGPGKPMSARLSVEHADRQWCRVALRVQPRGLGDGCLAPSLLPWPRMRKAAAIGQAPAFGNGVALAEIEPPASNLHTACRSDQKLPSLNG